MADGRAGRNTVVSEIRIYVEGGGDASDGKAAIREGFNQFLSPLRELAKQKRIRWKIIACGGRDAAFDGFKTALRQHSEAFNVLLVDAEGPVHSSPWEHLATRDGWKTPEGCSDEHCHLMVQTVEAWLIADRETLERYYGQNFHCGSLPAANNVEAIPKDRLEPSLTQATKDTRKGRYHKIRHCSELLRQLDNGRVRERAPHCERLFAVLEAHLRVG